jgi:hypothetical protein
MLISGREAVRILLTSGAMTGEAQARGMLRAGAAGPGVITDTGVFFDREAVRALASRPLLDDDGQQEACPRGVYLARLSRSSGIDLTRPWADIAEQVDRVPAMPTMTTALLEVSVRITGRLPWVATLHGFVVLGADLTGLDVRSDGHRFRLDPPGEWYAAWHHHRVASKPGGRPWVIRRPRAS